MATLTITVPESGAVTAAAFLESAARGYGWHPSQGTTAEQAIIDHIERDLHHRFRTGATHLSRDEIEAELPIPQIRARPEVPVEAPNGGDGAPR